MQFTPYLNFDGHCAEAFAFYAEVFGGEIAFRATFGEMPPSEDMPPLPESAKDRIMNMCLNIGPQSLMGSDTLPGADPTCGGGFQQAQGMWVAIQLDDLEQARRIFDALAQDGDTTMPFQPTFWSSGFGMCRDRFGTPWMVNVANPEYPA